MRLAALLLALSSAPPAAGEPRDYLTVFAADGVPYSPTKGHTFAALVRVAEEPGRPPCVVESVSLSWLPATLKVRGLALRPEDGRNVPLDETFRYARAAGCRLCLWGPYRVRPELAETFKARVAAVEAGFGYKGACLTSPLDVCDCVRSVEEMIDPRRRYIGVFGYGAAASGYVVRKFSPWLIEPEQTHPWVGTLIGLDEHPIARRPFGDYTTRWDQMGASVRRR